MPATLVWMPSEAVVRRLRHGDVLLTVDLQRDFLPGGRLPVKAGAAAAHRVACQHDTHGVAGSALSFANAAA